MTHGEYAAQLFCEGYNCAQAVAVAFCDVTGVDKCVILPYWMNGSIQCVRETIGEHPPELVVCKQGCDFIDLSLDGLRHKESVLRGRTL